MNATASNGGFLQPSGDFNTNGNVTISHVRNDVSIASVHGSAGSCNFGQQQQIVAARFDTAQVWRYDVALAVDVPLAVGIVREAGRCGLTLTVSHEPTDTVTRPPARCGDNRMTACLAATATTRQPLYAP
jgi:hypothetical protein